MHRWVAMALLWIAAMGAAPAVAHAREEPQPSEQEAALAREAFLLGSALSKQGQWTEALAAFERSASFRPHPTTTYNVGYCLRALGRLTSARALFRHAVDAPGDDALPEDLRTEALAYLDEIENKLGRAVVTIPPEVAIAIDGRPLEVAAASTSGVTLVAGTRPPGPPDIPPSASFDLVLDPGSHIVVLRLGETEKTFEKHVDAGAVVQWNLELAPPVVAARPPPPPRPAPPPTFATRPPPPKQPDTHPGRVAGYITLGIGTGAAVGGFVSMIVAVDHMAVLDEICPAQDDCPASAQPRIDRMNTAADVTTGLSAIGFGAMAVGVLLILLDPGSTVSEPTLSADGPTMTLRF